MPWVRFTAAHSHVPAAVPTVSIAYKPGMTVLVTTECAENAINKGRAVRASKPPGDDSGATRNR